MRKAAPKKTGAPLSRSDARASSGGPMSTDTGRGILFQSAADAGKESSSRIVTVSTLHGNAQQVMSHSVWSSTAGSRPRRSKPRPPKRSTNMPGCESVTPCSSPGGRVARNAPPRSQSSLEDTPVHVLLHSLSLKQVAVIITVLASIGGIGYSIARWEESIRRAELEAKVARATDLTTRVSELTSERDAEDAMGELCLAVLEYADCQETECVYAVAAFDRIRAEASALEQRGAALSYSDSNTFYVEFVEDGIQHTVHAHRPRPGAHDT
jgi:hypothetical protein